MENKLIDKLIEQQEQIKAMQENEDSAIKVMKMYEDCKKRIDKAIEYVEESYNETVQGIEGVAKFFSKRNETLLKILKGEYKYE